MDRRLTFPLRAGALALSALLLAGCWTTGSDDGAGTTASNTPGAAAGQPAIGAPAPACPAGDAASDSYVCAGVTVTGAKDEAPTITLDAGFAPATELVVADVYEGTGDPVTPGATVTAHYVGMGEQSRQVFDSSWPSGAPLTFPLDQVIEGWQEGLQGMKPGGRRLLVIPGSLAYGPDGRAPVIGPDETLVFVVDLVEQTPAP